MNLLVSLNGSFSVTTLETSSERSNVYSVILLTLLTPSRKTKWLVLNEPSFPALQRNECSSNMIQYNEIGYNMI